MTRLTADGRHYHPTDRAYAGMLVLGWANLLSTWPPRQNAVRALTWCNHLLETRQADYDRAALGALVLRVHGGVLPQHPSEA